MRCTSHLARALACWVWLRGHGWFSGTERHRAAPTTQGPADRIGQGGGRLSRPRFTNDTNAPRAGEVQCNLGPATKLGMDLGPLSRRGGAMDGETQDLVIQLCTRIGMIMEDTSVLALNVKGMDSARRRAALRKIEQAADRIHALVAAAKALKS